MELDPARLMAKEAGSSADWPSTSKSRRKSPCAARASARTALSPSHVRRDRWRGAHIFRKMYYVPSGTDNFHSADDNGKGTGYWVEVSAPQYYDLAKDGSHYWGVVQFQFNEAYNEFEGTWDFCGKDLKHGWKGKRRL